MNTRHVARIAAVIAVVCLGLVSGARAAEFRTLVNDGRKLDYLLVLPENFHTNTPYPVLLALPPGEQSRKMAQDALDMYWEAEARSRGWVVIAPIAQKGKSFHSGLERAIPFLLDDVARSVTFEGGRAHVAGVSNGGKSAYRVATEYPTRFLSLTVLPGFPPDDRAELNLRALKQLPGGVTVYVGEKDAAWLQSARTTKQKLDAYGISNTLEVWPGGEHIVAVRPFELFDMLDRKRPGRNTEAPPTVSVPSAGSVGDAAPTPPPGSAAPASAPPGSAPSAPPGSAPVAAAPAPPAPMPQPAPAAPPPQASPEQPAPAPAPSSEPVNAIDELRETKAINAVLDDFHDAAAKADEARYFAHFAPEAVFLGTDATERWTLGAFREFAHPYFAKGKAWTYTPSDRKVAIAPIGLAGQGPVFAWFDEMLANDKLGVTRGSGVLRKIDGVWRVAQYNLSIPVPNDLADEVTAKIKEKTGHPVQP